MKQIICEMCGSSDLIKEGGVFVCQNCGTKYSVEEAKRMMVEGVVQVDHSNMTENYLSMAISACNSGNYAEAENYANRVIEIDPNNYLGWFIKGKSAGWQSTLANVRLDEYLSAGIKAIQNAPEDAYSDMVDDVENGFSDLASALIKLRADRFAKWPDEEEFNGLISDCKRIATVCKTYSSAGIQLGLVILPQKFMKRIPGIIHTSVFEAYKKIIEPEFSGQRNKPDDDDLSKYFNRLNYCIALVELAVNLSPADDEENIQRYESLIFYHEKAINACSYRWEYHDYVNGLGPQAVIKYGGIPDVNGSGRIENCQIQLNRREGVKLLNTNLKCKKLGVQKKKKSGLNAKNGCVLKERRRKSDLMPIGLNMRKKKQNLKQNVKVLGNNYQL